MSLSVDRPLKKNALLEEALHYLQIHRPAQALELLQNLLAEYPTSGYLAYLIGWCYFGLNQNNKAFEYCQKAFRLGHDPVMTQFLHAKILIELNRFAEAEQTLLEVLREEPEYTDALAEYSYVMLKTGHVEKSEKLLEKAKELEPENPVVLRMYYNLYLTKNDKKAMRFSLEEYIYHSDNQISQLLRVGLYELMQNNYKLARENFKQAFLLDPTNTQVLELLKETQRHSNIFYLPQRLINRIGGTKVVWIGTIAAVLILEKLNQRKIASVILTIYFCLFFYTWILFGVEKWFEKRGVARG